MRNSRPEHELLFAIGRREVEVERVRRLVKQVRDWNYPVNTANAHGLTPLLQKHLPADLTPVNVLSRLKLQSVANTQNVLHLVGKQLKVYRSFKESNIRVAILKGSVLSQMVYGDVALRQAGDIDVLISRADFAAAKIVLEALGYQMTPSLTERQVASHLAFHCEIQFVRDDWFTVVDLHWGLSPRSFVFGLTEDEVMSRLQTVSFAGTETKTFSTEDLILYQAMHGAKHLWRRLERIASLAELVRNLEEFSWSQVVDCAIKARATRILALGLRLAENFGVE